MSRAAAAASAGQSSEHTDHIFLTEGINCDSKSYALVNFTPEETQTLRDIKLDSRTDDFAEIQRMLSKIPSPRNQVHDYTCVEFTLTEIRLLRHFLDKNDHGGLGTKLLEPKSQVISSQSLSDSSVLVNRTWNGERWEGNGYVRKKCTNAGALHLLINATILASSDEFHIYCNEKQLPHFVYMNALAFVFGQGVVSIGKYAVAIRRPSFFPAISMDPFTVVDAAMRGQEDVVMNILRADPSYLLQKAKVKNSVGVEDEVTPLQAALMANDIQMVERMQEHFERLTGDLAGNPIDGMAEMHRQIKEIYTLSLQKYLSLQKINIAALQSDDIEKMVEAHHLAQENNAFVFSPYVDAILNAPQAELDDVMLLINADKLVFADFNPDEIQELQQIANSNQNTPKRLVTIMQSMSQPNNNGRPPEFNHNEAQWLIHFTNEIGRTDLSARLQAKIKEKTIAAIAATGVGPCETPECLGKPFDQLTLVQKLNRFREKFAEHMKHEIIFNPHHILAGLNANLAVWDTLPDAQDQNYHKRIIIFSQLCGWAQRLAAEPVKQDIRQGTWYLIEENEPRARQSRFNDIDSNYQVTKNSFADVSLIGSSVVGGLGYKFAGGECLVGPGWWAADVLGGRGFQNLCQTKTANFQKLLQRGGPRCRA